MPSLSYGYLFNAEGVFSDVSVCSIIYHFLATSSCTKSLLCVIVKASVKPQCF
jgi:hypothetical protein